MIFFQISLELAKIIPCQKILLIQMLNNILYNGNKQLSLKNLGFQDVYRVVNICNQHLIKIIINIKSLHKSSSQKQLKLEGVKT
jgi:hypothetical protein